ncbi:MAG: N-acetylmuramoyl-L-alanine amidase [Pseudomonadota bacterium]
MKIIERPSPNFDARGRAVDMAILHYTGMRTGEEAIERLCDPAAKVSAHYVVEEDGRVFRLVAEENRAWHAGVSSWRGEADINARSVGVEIVNPGHEFGYRDFPSAQIEAVIALLKDIISRHDIAPNCVLGHSDVAPSRKEDPGEKFPWARLAAEGLAIGPYEGEGDQAISYEDALTALSAIGYDAPTSVHVAALLAFQRRYCPAALGQGFSPLTKAALLHVLERHND